MKHSIARAEVVDTISTSVGLAVGTGAMLLQAYLVLELCRKAAIIAFGLN